MDKLIYLDNAAPTKVDDEVVQEMLPYFTEIYGNSNSLHRFGLDANKAVNLARERIANALNCSSNEIYFTSGGTE
ncbi:MAG: aminotransferase class V-fold PLP-dependent enzyme, partial [Clostridia bacterium]|nr:aminotransferase class V-fold PLP-dependent enzyme [Clostridia bacterium]